MARSYFSRSLGYRAEQTGFTLATGNVPLTFQRTLMPRSAMDQALVTGLSWAAHQGIATFLQEAVQSAALLAVGDASSGSAVHLRRWSRASLVADGAAAALGLGIQRAFAQRTNEGLPRAGLRTAGFYLTATGIAGAAVGGLQEAAHRRGRPGWFVAIPAAGALTVGAELWRRRRARLDAAEAHEVEPEMPVGKALALALGVAAAAGGLSQVEHRLADRIARTAAAALPGNELVWRPLGHAASLFAFGYGIRSFAVRGFKMIERREESVEPSFDMPPLTPLVSGSMGSHVPFGTLSKQGRRFVWNGQAADVIEGVMGEPAQEPVRVYVGLGSADTPDGRVALAMQELERTAAFDRSWLLVDLPTGTGYVNYAAVSALEMLTRGDCATVAVQYAARPSPLSLDRVDEGNEQTRLLLDAIHARMQDIPTARRPCLVLFGESLGAWTSQDPFIDSGTQGLLDRGVDYAIWIGTPHFSRWKEEVLRDNRPDVLPELIGVFNDIDEWRATPSDVRRRMRFIMITHHNDGVARFGPGLFVQAPEWLGDPRTRWDTIPKGMRWVPYSTFFQVLVDMKNSANVVPGVFAATGHDYRADLLPFFHAVLGIKVTDEQLKRIDIWLQRRELLRATWVRRHGTADTSVSATLLTQWLAEEPERATTLLRERIRALAKADFVAGGGIETDAPVG